MLDTVSVEPLSPAVEIRYAVSIPSPTFPYCTASDESWVGPGNKANPAEGLPVLSISSSVMIDWQKICLAEFLLQYYSGIRYTFV